MIESAPSQDYSPLVTRRRFLGGLLGTASLALLGCQNLSPLKVSKDGKTVMGEFYITSGQVGLYSYQIEQVQSTNDFIVRKLQPPGRTDIPVHEGISQMRAHGCKVDPKFKDFPEDGSFAVVSVVSDPDECWRRLTANR